MPGYGQKKCIKTMCKVRRELPEISMPDTAHLFIIAGDNNFPFISAATGTDPVGDDWGLTVGTSGMSWRSQRLVCPALPFPGF